MSMSCRVPDDYEPDLEANAVVQVKRKVSSSSATPKEPQLKIVSQLDKRHVSKWSGIPQLLGHRQDGLPDMGLKCQRQSAQGCIAGRGGEILPEMLQAKTAAYTSLQSVQAMRTEVSLLQTRLPVLYSRYSACSLRCISGAWITPNLSSMHVQRPI